MVQEYKKWYKRRVNDTRVNDKKYTKWYNSRENGTRVQ